MNHILLLGAGFSNNWDGWLASQVNDHLPTSSHIRSDPYLQDVLRRTTDKGGFEAALTEVQDNYNRTKSAKDLQHMQNIQAAIADMFADMEAGFASKTSLDFPLDVTMNGKFKVSKLLALFDAIFTLNQDLLLERHYQNIDIALMRPQKWNGCKSPGLRALSDNNSRGALYDIGKIKWTPNTPQPFSTDMGIQPYFKLHGSWNWWSSDGEQMLILGGDKLSLIERYPLLNWYREQFKAHLSKPDTRLMVIGYGFGDRHINEMIYEAWTSTEALSMFINHPRGRSILPEPLDQVINAGTSTLFLKETFGGNEAERLKIMRFFAR